MLGRATRLPALDSLQERKSLSGGMAMVSVSSPSIVHQVPSCSPGNQLCSFRFIVQPSSPSNPCCHFLARRLRRTRACHPQCYLLSFHFLETRTPPSTKRVLIAGFVGQPCGTAQTQCVPAQWGGLLTDAVLLQQERRCFRHLKLCGVFQGLRLATPWLEAW